MGNGHGCATDTTRLNNKCNKDDNWKKQKWCQLSCFNAGNGYPGDVCCNGTTPPPTPAPVTPSPTDMPVTTEPTPNPTDQPTPAPVPTGGGDPCCAERNDGYQACKTDDWCNASDSNCGNCGGAMVVVPLQQTGCCSWGGGDCSSIDPATNYGCHMMQSDCEQSCGGSWQAF